MKKLLIAALVSAAAASATATAQKIDTTLTPKQVYYMLKDKALYVEVGFAIYALESGHGKSRLAKTNLNIFGMKPSTYRQSTSTAVRNGYAAYVHQGLSVYDYLLYEMFVIKTYKVMNEWDYWKHICDNYKSDSVAVEDYAQQLVNQMLWNRKHYDFVEKTSMLIY